MRTVESDNWSQPNLFKAILIMRNLIDRLEFQSKSDTFSLAGKITKTEYRTLVLCFKAIENMERQMRQEAVS